jgi:hypothetical protein
MTEYPIKFSKHNNIISVLNDGHAYNKDVQGDIWFCKQNIILHMTEPEMLCFIHVLKRTMDLRHYAQLDVSSVHSHY